MTSSFTDNLYRLISNDQLEEVIALLQDGNHWIPEEAKDEMLIISKLLREVKQQEVSGNITKEKQTYRKQTIRKLLTQFVEKHFVPSKDATIFAKLDRLVLWGIILVLVLVLTWVFIINN